MGIVFLLVELDLWPKVHIASAMIVVHGSTCTLMIVVAHDEPTERQRAKGVGALLKGERSEPRALEVRARSASSIDLC